MVLEYFSQIGYQATSKFVNPSDFLMRVIYVEYPKGQEENEKIGKLVEAYKNS